MNEGNDTTTISGVILTAKQPGLYEIAPDTLVTEDALKEAVDQFNQRTERRPWTMAESRALTREEQLAQLRKANPCMYEGWHPYCMTCGTMNRMHQEDYGFRCTCCGNMIAWDLTRIAESPLNRRREAQHAHQSEYGQSILIADGGISSIASAALARLLRSEGHVIVEAPIPEGIEIPFPKINFSVGYDADRSYMKPTPAPYSIVRITEPTAPRGEGYRDPDKHSRKTHGDIGPTGRSDRHRKQQRISKASRRRNRRKR